MESMQTFEGLECCKAARQLRLFVSREVIAAMPRDERFELTSQLRRAARSVTANIAEGYGRYHFRDNYKFCSNARGSLFEVFDHLITANDEGYLKDELLEKGSALFLKTKQLLNGYMSYLSRAADGPSVIREDIEESLRTHEYDHA